MNVWDTNLVISVANNDRYEHVNNLNGESGTVFLFSNGSTEI